ncbi:MAG: hypothetical protein HQL39_07680 [Alphaproteobacteria bacterium]|nr:hypothetical protein [Alphaproteobacteria bacterium]
MRVLVTCAAIGVMVAASPAAAQFTAQQVSPYESQQIQPFESEQIRPNRSERVRPDRGERVRPDRAERVRPDRGERVAPNAGGDRREAAVDARCDTADQSPRQMMGRWQTFVPGSVVETPRGVEVGIAGGGAFLDVSEGGNYEWGNIAGKWKKSTEGDGWPVVLTKAREGKNWKLSLDGDTCELLLWDGMTHLRGKRVR